MPILRSGILAELETRLIDCHRWVESSEPESEMENPYWHPEEKNHVVKGDEVRDLAFDIFNIVRASMSLRSESADKDEDDDADPTHIEQAHYDLAEYHFSTKLLRLAVLMRTLDDYWSSWGHEDYVEALKKLNKETAIGTLDANKRSTDLTMREAFNKIIHAADVRPVYEKDDDAKGEAIRWGMDGQLELTGTFRKDTWKAVLNIEPLLDAAVKLLEVTEDLQS